MVTEGVNHIIFSESHTGCIAYDSEQINNFQLTIPLYINWKHSTSSAFALTSWIKSEIQLNYNKTLATL